MQSTSTQAMLQSVLKARKTRKTISGGEAVWPLDLEAALLEGKLFSLYLPDRSLTPCFYRAGTISTRPFSRDPHAGTIPASESLYLRLHFR
jgi:hypothetical protein